MFKWVAVLTLDGLPINEKHREALAFIDYAFITTKSGYNEFQSIGVPCSYLPYGPDRESFFSRDFNDTDILRVMNVSKNVAASNLGNFIEAAGGVSEHPVEFYLHTNIHDTGYQDLYALVERYGAKNLDFPSDYVGINDGIDQNKLADEFR